MTSATEFLAQAAEALLEADDQGAIPSAQVPLLKALTALTLAAMAIAVELGVPPPAISGQPTGQIPGQGTLPV